MYTSSCAQYYVLILFLPPSLFSHSSSCSPLSFIKFIIPSIHVFLDLSLLFLPLGTHSKTSHWQSIFSHPLHMSKPLQLFISHKLHNSFIKIHFFHGQYCFSFCLIQSIVQILKNPFLQTAICNLICHLQFTFLLHSNSSIFYVERFCEIDVFSIYSKFFILLKTGYLV